LLAMTVMYLSEGRAGLDDFEPASEKLLTELYVEEDDDAAAGGGRLAEVSGFVAETGGEVG
jgi:hypothetical protein